MNAALATSGLGFTYGHGFALQGVDLAVARGRFCVLLGPNGAGKSTLVCLLTRLFAPSAGGVSINGHALAERPRQALAGLGVVFQQTTLDLDLTVAQNLRYAASLHGLAGGMARQRITEELDRAGLWDSRDQPARRLSGGNRRKLELARALLHRPSLLICDEPTVGLDLPSRRALVAHVRGLCAQSGLAVLWTTHLMDEVEEEDQVVLIHRGRVRAEGTARGLMDSTGAADMEAAFVALTAGEGA
jgi:ABC-2 type transport system ATP-binding protein